MHDALTRLRTPVPPHSLDEFLAFSSMLGRLPPDQFRAVVGRYTVKVKEEMKKKAQARAAAAAAMGEGAGSDETKT